MAKLTTRVGKDGKTHYHVRIRRKGAGEVSRTFARLTDARIFIQSTETAIRDGKGDLVSAPRKTLADAIDRYIDTVIPGKRDQRAPRLQLAWWREYLGPHMLQSISPAKISEARDILQRTDTDWTKSKRKSSSPRSKATVNRYLAILSNVFTVAVREWHWVSDNPVTKVAKFKEPRGRVRFLDDSERERLLAECQKSGHPLLYPAVVLALASGARQAEVMASEWAGREGAKPVSVLNLKDRTLTLFETKNSDPRVVGLADSVVDVLGRMRSDHPNIARWVFPGRGGRKPIDLRAPFLLALGEAGIENFRWHDLRHSTASYLAMAGATPSEIAAVLGHRQLTMVKRYAHLSESHVSALTRTLGDSLLKGPASKR